MQAHWFEIGSASALFAGMWLATELGFRLGRRRARDDGDRGQLATVQAAILGLLGLLLGFSFSGATSRFVDRQDLIVSEANAIGTAYLRADLLPEPHRSALRGVLRELTRERLTLFREVHTDSAPAILRRIGELETQMWSAAVAGVDAQAPTALAVLAPLNEVIDLHGMHAAAAARHLPIAVLVLLIACALAALGTIGMGCGVADQRHGAATGTLALLVATMLWVTIDLDHPRRGLIQLSDAPLQALLATIGA